MTSRHRKCKFFTLTLLLTLLCSPQTVVCLARAPVDYLVPPPLPQINSAVRPKTASLRPQNLLASESRAVPQYINTQPPAAAKTQNDPGIMTRVARWFGFANQNIVTDQQLALASNKQPYYYQKPQQQGQYVSGDKEPCSLCNKYPWVPMMANSIHFSQAGNQWDASKQLPHQHNQQQYPINNNLQNSYKASVSPQQQPVLHNSYGVPIGQASPPQIQHAASSVKQRAVKFNFPVPFLPPPISNIPAHLPNKPAPLPNIPPPLPNIPHPPNIPHLPNIPPPPPNKTPDAPNQIHYSSGPFLPIPIPPQLSNSALPPIYNAQNFLPPISPLPNTLQELPSTEPARFVENIGEHSEIHLDTVIPTQIPPTIPQKDLSFEIVKSHQLVDYVSSVEYPASFVPSHAVDVTTLPPQLPSDNSQTEPQISTGLYQHSTFSPFLSQHTPASQILTDPNSFVVDNQEQANQQSVNYEQTTPFNQQPQYLEQVQHNEYDNYASASQQNSSIYDQQSPQHQQHQTNLDAWTLESNDYVYATSTPEVVTTTPEFVTTTTYRTELETTTQPQIQDNEVEFIASIQTNVQNSNKDAAKVWSQKTKQRDTPKRMLDSPIQHNSGNLGAPRPFTKDPSNLTFRLAPVNHKLPEANRLTSSQEVWKLQTPTTQSPLSTSTFSSIDASGQYAGMSPPSLPSTYNSDQMLLPHYTSKNRPRPFETTKINFITQAPAIWNQKQNIELHTPQESMLVRSHIKPLTINSTTTTKPRPTKYLTKILASNLRELLQREHEPTKLKLSPNSLDIDIGKLQKNIDDWTEQEYTSLSHRPSTPTIRGRSKHIPSEYLPTTMAVAKARQSKTTKGFTDTIELPSSINNLEPLYERGSTKHFHYTPLIDNTLSDLYNNLETTKSKSIKTTTPAVTTSSSTTTTRTTTTTTTEKPLYLRPIEEPEELWKKAKVSISPKTQEKVYVVTPQPRFFPQRFYSPTSSPTTTTTTTTSTEKSSLSNFGSGFKSPRFLVRPTPGNAHILSKISDTQSKEDVKENLSNSYFTPEWFGLRGLSAYVPSEPVEIIDGNSKVFNIVTPPSNLETTTSRHNIMDLTKDRHSANRKKSTMAPSPR